MGEVDPAFIQAEENRPKLSLNEAEDVPLIDLSSSLDDVVSEIGNACKEWGFFQVINHGFPLEKYHRVQDCAKKFFGLPLEEKNKIRRVERQPLGYYDGDHTNGAKDCKEVYEFVAGEPFYMPVFPDDKEVPLSYYFDPPDPKEVTVLNNVWAENPPELKEALEDYIKEVENFANKLLELIAQSLGLPANRFHSFFKEQVSASYHRFNYYPACPAKDLAFGVSRHKDAIALTVLYQDDVGGLQVKRMSDGEEWVPVKPIPGAYVVNVGDILQVWSNDAYKSVEHRVLANSKNDRFSIPFFHAPPHDTMVQPLEEMINEQNPPKFKAYCWGKFYSARRLSNFQKLPKTIQISDFRIN